MVRSTRARGRRGEILLAVVAALVVVPDAVLARQDGEAIEAFDVVMEVQPGGAMTVTERLTVRVRGEQIRRGIFRDFPTTFPRRFGLGRIEAPFDVVSVTRNGEPEPFVLEGIGDGFGRGGVRVRIGQRNVLLEQGTHVYELVYTTDRWVRFGDDTDELYWNVTGNGWAFPIERATARIRIDGLEATPEIESWTGYEGATGMDGTAVWDGADGAAVFAVDRTLQPGEGLTVRLRFPSGQLAPPTEAQTDAWMRMDWGGYIDAGYIVLLVIGVYLLMWRRVGMDPAPGPTRLRTAPPEGYSPAELGFIESRGFDEEQLSAALVSLALKGAIRIEEDDGTWTLHRLTKEPQGLAPEEEKLFEKLLATRSSIELDRGEHQRLKGAIRAFRRSLKLRLEKVYFRNNRSWFFAGLGISVLGFAALGLRWSYAINPVALFLAFWLTGWTLGTGTLVYRIWQMARSASSSGSGVQWAGVGGLALFALPFVGAEIFVGGLLAIMVPTHLILAAVLIGLTNVVFYHLLERPTLRGRGVLDELDGFRAWLAGADDEVAGSDRTLSVFERHLPYAIALGLADQWTTAFSGVLDSLRTAPAGAHPLPWYTHDHRNFSPSSFSSSLGTSLGSTLSSMSSPPASSGGGGGGGFSSGGSSGGGGGGGGGGGW